MNSTKPRNQGSRSRIVKLFSALVIASLVLAVGMSASSLVDKYGRPDVALTGMVGDTACGSAHGPNAQRNGECTRQCVEMGAGYALVVGKKIYLLQGHKAELDKFAGETVVVRGKVHTRDTVVVESITPVVIEVLAGIQGR